MIHVQEMDLNQSFSRMKPYHSPPPSHHITRVHTRLNKLNWFKPNKRVSCESTKKNHLASFLIPPPALMSDSDDPSTSFRDISTLKKWKRSLVPTVGDRKPASSSAEPLNRVFLQSKHGPDDGVTRLSWSPEGIQPPSQRAPRGWPKMK